MCCANQLDPDDREQLFKVARAAIEHGLEQGVPPKFDPALFSAPLQAIRASFVTLHKNGRLRGCIGHLEATQALVVDVAGNAYAAAFTDPRFPPMDRSEFTELVYHISILHPAQALQFASEADVLRQLQPGVDGLILKDGQHRATFLPTVWSSLPDPGDFLRHLKYKAGLAPDYWSPTLQIARYATEDLVPLEPR
jgi:AmmeMemoRadiSam system protein A